MYVQGHAGTAVQWILYWLLLILRCGVFSCKKSFALCATFLRVFVVSQVLSLFVCDEDIYRKPLIQRLLSDHVRVCAGYERSRGCAGVSR